MRFAQRVFLICGLLGIAMLAPMYFTEALYSHNYPPAINHPEFYYGFVGLALVFQFAFLIIASDPLRYRPLMLIGVLEKIVFGAAAIPLAILGRTPAIMALAGCLDLTMGVFFALAWWQTRERM
ncbi:MAG TPA: hypothetical protein VL096_13765 [Pirellulaceae bacterium]|nr:hypothetical protein [Pirellulaceae bacterium]